jgi:importin-5
MMWGVCFARARLQEFCQTVIPLAMRMLLEIPDDLAEWEKDLEGKDRDADNYQNYQMGLEAIDRMAMSLGGKLFMQHTLKAIQEWLREPNPLARHAALMALGEMAEGCQKQLKPQLNDIVRCVRCVCDCRARHRLTRPRHPRAVRVLAGWWWRWL